MLEEITFLNISSEEMKEIIESVPEPTL